MVNRNCERVFYLLGLILVLFVIGIPVTYGFGLVDKADRVECLNQLHQIFIAATQYADDNDGKLPRAQKVEDVASMYSPYLPNSAIFRCPGREKSGNIVRYENLTSQTIDYGFSVSKNGQPLRLDQSSSILVVFDQMGEGQILKLKLSQYGERMVLSQNHDYEGGNILFNDGSVRWIKSGASWKDLNVDPDLEVVQ